MRRPPIPEAARGENDSAGPLLTHTRWMSDELRFLGELRICGLPPSWSRLDPKSLSSRGKGHLPFLLATGCKFADGDFRGYLSEDRMFFGFPLGRQKGGKATGGPKWG